jgi:flavin reductase (DIM6/NTAB) family NADH-FMN oxidoreductase RutF
VDPAVKKKVLRAFPYGMYVVTVAEGEEVNAFTANWLTQASFEPPMVVFAMENDSRSLGMIERARAFAVNVLPEDARDFAGAMGRSSAQNPHKLAEVAYGRSPALGSPVLPECLGWVECALVSSTPAGDHTLLLGEVVEAGLGRDAKPLTMGAAGFRYSG